MPADLDSDHSSGVRTLEPRQLLQTRIIDGEYRVRRGEHGLSAPNRAHALRATWARDGVWVASRDESSSTAPNERTSSRLTTTAIARGDRVHHLPSPRFVEGGCRADGALDESAQCLRRVEADYGRGFREWWENRPDGLEQGFTLESKPIDGATGDSPLQVRIRFTSKDLSIDDDGGAVHLSLPNGARARVFAPRGARRGTTIRYPHGSAPFRAAQQSKSMTVGQDIRSRSIRSSRLPHLGMLTWARKACSRCWSPVPET